MKKPTLTRMIPILISTVPMSCALPSDQPINLGSLYPPPIFGRGHRKEVLLFSDVSTWKAEVDSLAYILYQHGVSYQEMNADGLNALTLNQLSEYQLIIFPGGNSNQILTSLSLPTREKIQSAVRHNGISYLGLCAGAFLAYAPSSASSERPMPSILDSLGIVSGPYLSVSYLAKKGLEKTLEKVSFPDGSTQDLLWYGGPETPNLPGGVIAKYANGSPAITQTQSESGFVIVSGLHPSITPWTLAELNLTPQSQPSAELTWQLLKSALHHRKLITF